jgi:hypothetical protein
VGSGSARADDIGFEAPPARPPAAVNKLLHDGLALHKAGKYAESLELFTRAVEIAPDDMIARFDVACAASRAGDVARAAAEMERLVSWDLPAYAAKLDADADLDALRKSPRGAALRARIGALQSAYSSAMKAGVAAVVYRAAPPAFDKNVLTPTWVRAGVWVEARRRFVPLSPDDAAAGTAWCDVARETCFVLEASPIDSGSDFSPRMNGRARLMGGKPFAARAEIDGEASLTEDEPFIWSVAALTAGPADAPADVFLELGDRSERWDGQRLVPVKGPPKGAATYEVMLAAEGALTRSMPKGFDVTARGELTTPRGDRIQLDRRHAAGVSTVLLDDDTALVVTSVSRCVCEQENEGDEHRHAVSVVHLGAKTASLVEQGPEAAFADAGPGGVYLQVGERVRRFASLAAVTKDGGAALPRGVLLVMPRRRPANCCGL